MFFFTFLDLIELINRLSSKDGKACMKFLSEKIKNCFFLFILHGKAIFASKKIFTKMIKMYVMKTCPYCEYVERQVQGNPNFQVIDIGQHVHNLAEFLNLRDHHPAFAEARAEGDVGIPAYVREDGSVTLSSAEVGLRPLSDDVPDAPACSIDGKGC